jgi:hypothetical protein
LMAHESFAPKCFKSHPFPPHISVPSNRRFGQLKILYPIESLIFLSRGSSILHLYPVRSLANVHLCLGPRHHLDMSNALKYLVFMVNLTIIFKIGYSC